MRSTAIIVLITAGAFALFVGLCGRTPAPPSHEFSAQLVPRFEEIERRVEALRGLPPSPIVRLFLDDAAMRDAIAEVGGRPEALVESALWAALGVPVDGPPPAPEDDGARAMYRHRVGDRIVRAVVAEDLGTPGLSEPREELAWVHAYTHAILHEAYTSAGNVASTADRGLADLALIEGDAIATARRYVAAHAPGEVGDIAALFAEHEQGPADALDRLRAMEVAFVTRRGVAFVDAVVEAGGARALDGVYEWPPVTTAEILHPELHLAHRAFREISTRDLAFALDHEGRSVDAGTAGEFLLLAWLELAGASPADAERAADGWDGGAYFLRRVDGDAPLLIARVAWRTDDAGGHGERDEFVAVLERTLDGAADYRRDPGDGPPRWITRDGSTLVVRSLDDGTLAIAVAPSAERAARSIDRLATMPLH